MNNKWTKIIILYFWNLMEIYYQIDGFKAKNPVVTIGTFDGVHLGHRKILKRLKEIAREIGGETVLFTFYPHPRLSLNPQEKTIRLLTTLEEKIVQLEKAGIEHLIIYPFTKEFSELSYTEFVESILVGKIKTSCLVVGHDHKFGKNREGGFEYLKAYAEKYHFRIERIDALMLDSINISSTKIRKALQSGDIEEANKYLGYEFTLHGKVVKGKQVGSRIGFPTANIEASDIHKIIPGYGVYAVRVDIQGKVYNGMLNIGTRPTFNKNADNRSIEVNIFDFDKDIYHQNITLCFVRKIREEKKFNSPEALTEQLEKDKKAALAILQKA
ncbi:FMN adenylyltransferase / Riboflavin kinase [hydrothermal vent metagenome]|uniref:Bifunctional riboflavin kinase/FMN adenylyltransferase n=1 Tax=hydrothermal vent metagenome TaxID=652676 RepID=A0A3B0TGB7_9ZZZZ